MAYDVSPTARALLALEVIQDNPGITAQQLGGRLGVSDRAARRYVAILREAELPVEAVSGPHGGYRVGRGLRLPPLMFTAVEAMGLVMAVLEGHRLAADPGDPVGRALAKIVRSLPQRVAGPVRAVRETSAAPRPAPEIRVSPELTSRLIEACATARPLRLVYRLRAASEGQADRELEIEPWAVVLRHSRWYLLGWSRTRQARRALRVDRITAVEPQPGTFTPPADGCRGAWATWSRPPTAGRGCGPRRTTRTGTSGGSPSSRRRSACSGRSRSSTRWPSWAGT
ncbi:MAG: WYL domain-containing protein [Streptosporangiaceae bacterium]